MINKQYRFYEQMFLLHNLDDQLEDNVKVFLQNIIGLSEKNYKEFNFPTKLLHYYNFILRNNPGHFRELIIPVANDVSGMNYSEYITVLSMTTIPYLV
jgi:hypothetical protein